MAEIPRDDAADAINVLMSMARQHIEYDPPLQSPRSAFPLHAQKRRPAG
jgi:hypothetical protein